jgi:hypothetical protein
MTEVQADQLEKVGDALSGGTKTSRRWDKVEAFLERSSEHLNPILVKEARQALKSRQFAITFILLLVCGWGWSFVGLAIAPNVGYAPVGAFMLQGYYLILTAPLFVMVPFTAFRSLASEREDGTYELLSITTLAPRQIIGGKLGSAVLQMLVYLSALSPCIAFTYMLRGIDILMIGMILGYVFLVSVMLSLLCLLLATITREKHWQVVLSVAIVIGLAALFLWGLDFGFELLDDQPVLRVDDANFWIGHAAILTNSAGFFALFYLAAAARITFPSENRSTRLRVVMLLQHLLMLAWFIYLWVTETEFGVLMVYMCFAAFYWYLMGVLMNGESGTLSPRARRALPQGLLGRALLTWFNPGPGTGYVFAMANLFASLVLVLEALALAMMMDNDFGYLDWETVAAVAIAAFCYVAIYLGVGRLVMVIARKVTRAGIVLSVLMHILLVLAGVLIPLVVQFSVMREDDYTPLQVSNPFWTINELAEERDIWDLSITVGPVDIPSVLLPLVFGAGLMMLIQLAVVSPEVRRHVHLAAPKRVEEEEAELHPPPPRAPQNPWDEVET